MTTSPIRPLRPEAEPQIIREFDHERAEAAVRELLYAIGEDPTREGLLDTPARVARAYAELTQGLRQTPEEVLSTTFDLGHDEMVLVRDIELWSMCEHHLVPFTGVAHVGYIPAASGKITGLSKLARLVDVYAKRPQVQERLTTQVADALMEILEARGVIVVIEAEHLCMTMRGVRKAGARTITSAVRGILHNAATRGEAMALIRGTH
ncbi:GTP cyclohydrolase I FolE [Nocardioides fonticola]|uniref:GTP cyclohydrolase 1 n=1 Tax=Nocardioides fonticola TaxID=450363 RepID=A0ABP7XC93_9ACTN